MKTVYGDIPQSEINKQKQYFYGAIISLLYFKENNYPFLDQRIQSLINEISGSIKLFNNSVPKILSIIALLEDARINSDQFRKNVLDAANMIDKLKGGNSDV